MLDFLRWRNHKRGLAPGSLVYAGRDKSFQPTLNCCSFSPQDIQERELEDQPCPAFDKQQTHLLQLTGVHDPAKVKQVGEWLGIHQLFMEDIMNTGQRPKLEQDDDAIFMVFKDVEFNQETGRAVQHHLGVYWSGNTVLTFQEHAGKPWENVLARIRSGKGKIRGGGAPYLAIALIDTMIDKYYSVLSALSLRASDLEAELSERLTEASLMDLYAIKREVVLLRSTFIPARDMLDELASQDSTPIPEQTLPYLANVRDHSQQVIESSSALHDILSDMLAVQLSLAGMHMNNVMKVLTIIATIFIPLTFLAGIYGMNFDTMPELHWKYGYPMLLGVMGIVAGIMVLFFKRRDWF